MDTKVNYTIIGVVGFLLIAAFIAAIIWLTASRRGLNLDTYVTYFKQEVTGLQKQGLVRYNGIQIGFVSDIKMDPNNLEKVVVYMKIHPDISITTSMVAVLESQGFTGGKYVGLHSTAQRAPLLELKSGERYKIIPSSPSLIGDLESSLKGVTKQMKQTITSLNELLGPTNRQSIKESLENVSKITGVIAKNSRKIDSSLASMQHILKQTSLASKEFPAMVAQTRRTLQAFENTATSLNRTGGQANKTLQRTSTTVQNISDQLLPSAQQLLQQLNQLLSNFSQLGDELSRNPSMLLWGKHPAPPGPGERRRMGEQ